MGDESLQPPIHLDGTTLEGGGQLLRLSLSLSSLTRIPIHVTDIRGKRGPKSNPGGKDGGLKPAHLACTEWLAKATRATTKGMVIGSKDLVFRPAGLNNSTMVIPEKSAKEPVNLGERPSEWWEEQPDDGVWTDVYEDGQLVRRESHIPMSTPGSIFLVLQAILPYILFSAPPAQGSACSQSKSKGKPVTVRIKIEGGTNAFHSLSFEYAHQVLFPMLHLKVGIPLINMTLHRRGWSMGRADVGSVTFDIMPIAPGFALPAFSIVDRGYLVKVRVSLLAPTATARANIREQVTEQLLRLHPDVEILFPVDEESGHNKRLYLLLVAETSNGHRLGRDWLFDRKIRPNALKEAVDSMVSKVVRDLGHELGHGGCTDEYMQDQLVVFQALARGIAVVDGGKGKEGSLHTQTARWVVEKVLGLRFDKGQCRGVGLIGGQHSWNPEDSKEAEGLTVGVEQLNI